MTFAESRIIGTRIEVDALLMEAEAMRTENRQRECNGEAQAYNGEAFMGISKQIFARAGTVYHLSQIL